MAFEQTDLHESGAMKADKKSMKISMRVGKHDFSLMNVIELAVGFGSS